MRLLGVSALVEDRLRHRPYPHLGSRQCRGAAPVVEHRGVQFLSAGIEIQARGERRESGVACRPAFDGDPLMVEFARQDLLGGCRAWRGRAAGGARADSGPDDQVCMPLPGRVAFQRDMHALAHTQGGGIGLNGNSAGLILHS